MNYVKRPMQQCVIFMFYVDYYYVDFNKSLLKDSFKVSTYTIIQLKTVLKTPTTALEIAHRVSSVPVKRFSKKYKKLANMATAGTNLTSSRLV